MQSLVTVALHQVYDGYYLKWMKVGDIHQLTNDDFLRYGFVMENELGQASSYRAVATPFLLALSLSIVRPSLIGRCRVALGIGSTFRR